MDYGWINSKTRHMRTFQLPPCLEERGFDGHSLGCGSDLRRGELGRAEAMRIDGPNLGAAALY